jgi:hypothetical protein
MKNFIEDIKHYLVYNYNILLDKCNETCYNCKYYGKCSIENKVCKDWTNFYRNIWPSHIYKESDDIENFNANWMSLHKKKYEKYDAIILEARIANVRNRERKEREGDFLVQNISN